MAGVIPTPVLPPEAMAWARAVTDALNEGRRTQAYHTTNIQAAMQTAASTSAAVEQVVGTVTEVQVQVNTRPAFPIALTVVGNSTYWSVSGIPLAQMTLQWTPVTTYEDGTPLGDNNAVTLYEVWNNAGDPVDSVLLASVEPSPLVGDDGLPTAFQSVLLQGLPRNTAYNLSVRARTPQGVWSGWSEPYIVTTDNTSAPLPAPSAPIVVSGLGAVTVRWDGNTNLASPPAAQYDYTIVYTSTTSGGTYVPVGSTLRRAGGIVITELPIGSTVWFKLGFVDKAGVASPLSTATSVVVAGVDLGDLDAEVSDAIEAAEQAAADAVVAADAATSAANAASIAAGNATTAANTATTTANGKNKVIWSTSAASGTTGYVAGDLWYRRGGVGNNEVIGVWEFLGGAWVGRTITDTAITNLNAATITAGTLNADRIGANTISTSKMLVGDFTNLADGSNFEVAANIPWSLPANMTRDTAQKFTGAASLKIAGTGGTPSATLLRPITVDVGESFYFEYNVYRDASWNGLGNNSKLRVADQTGALLFTIDYAAATIPAASWTVRSAVYVIPAGVTGLQVTLISDATAGNAWIDDILIRRMYQGALLVDGTITGTKILAETITGTNIAGETITGANIAAQTITGDKVRANTITAQEIAGNTITANEIAAGSITLNEIEAGIGGLIQLDANEFVVSIKDTAEAAASDVTDLSTNVEDMQTVYSFGPTGAIIYAPTPNEERSDTYMELRPDGISLHAAGFEASTWTAAEMHVPVMRGDQVILGNHQIETYGTGTVVRFVGQGG